MQKQQNKSLCHWKPKLPIRNSKTEPLKTNGLKRFENLLSDPLLRPCCYIQLTKLWNLGQRILRMTVELLIILKIKTEETTNFTPDIIRPL